MTLHREILTEQQQEVLRRLGPVATEEGFYLAGGTSIALVLGHRQSEPMPRMIWNADWRQVKQTVQEATRRVSS